MLRRTFSAFRRLNEVLRGVRMRIYLRSAFPGIHCHRRTRFGRGVTIRCFEGGSITIGPDTEIEDHALIVVERGQLFIGADCLIGRGSVIVCRRAIVIGNGTLIAEYVTIRDQDHNHATNERLGGQGMSSAPICIGHDVWLGAKVTVTKGVEIAPHAVVGAGAVVTRSLLGRAVYGGVPARLLRGASQSEPA